MRIENGDVAYIGGFPGKVKICADQSTGNHSSDEEVHQPSECPAVEDTRSRKDEWQQEYRKFDPEVFKGIAEINGKKQAQDMYEVNGAEYYGGDVLAVEEIFELTVDPLKNPFYSVGDEKHGYPGPCVTPKEFDHFLPGDPVEDENTGQEELRHAHQVFRQWQGY